MLRRLVEISSLDNILLPKILGVRDSIVKCIESLLIGWKFLGIDVNGRLGGLVVGCKFKNVFVSKLWRVHLGIGVEVFLEELGTSLIFSNIYSPSINKKEFRDKISGSYLLKKRMW